jgi:hypothetical protein
MGFRFGAAALFALAVTGCSHGHRRATEPTNASARTVAFADAPPAFRAQCRSTARALGYPIPCPLRVPRSFLVYVQRGMTRACKVTIVCPGTGAWRGWVEGTTQSWNAHLVIQASPHPLRNYAKLVYGPDWHPSDRVKPLARITVGGNRPQAVLVPSGSEALFGDHVVMIWTVGQHTYGVGFHNFTGLRQTLKLDEELVRHVALVHP